MELLIKNFKDYVDMYIKESTDDSGTPLQVFFETCDRWEQAGRLLLHSQRKASTNVFRTLNQYNKRWSSHRIRLGHDRQTNKTTSSTSRGNHQQKELHRETVSLSIGCWSIQFSIRKVRKTWHWKPIASGWVWSE